MARKFQLRNGWAVKEIKSSDDHPGDYSNQFATLEDMQLGDVILPKNTLLVLLTIPGGGYPIGGAHGAEFDIVEEL